jgi:hypothetical protein
VDWMPIESAPEEGVYVLVHIPPEFDDVPESRQCVCAWRWQGQWYLNTRDGELDDPIHGATHWMPLPPPPKEVP